MPELPEQLLNTLDTLPHFDRNAFIHAHRAENRVTSVRLNPFKPADLDLRISAAVPWSRHGFYLSERPSFTLDPLFHAGCYYVQEPGSMFLEHALLSTGRPIAGLKILDLCAAPGGKSTHLNSLIGDRGLLVSNELVKGRAAALVENLSKWGTFNSIVTNGEARKFGELGALFDVLVVDAPCSGSGLFRKQPEAVSDWSQDNVQMCCRRQKDILADALPALKTGGLLFYSTCSYSIEENEAVVDWLTDEMELQYLPVPLDASWGVVDTGKGYRFYPDKTQSEGFFCAIFRKNGPQVPFRAQKGGAERVGGAEKAITHAFVEPGKGEVIKWQGRLHFLSAETLQFLNETAGKLYLKKAGQFVGEIKGKDLVPSQELAWSIYLDEKVEKVEVDRDAALAFLRKSGFPVDRSLRGLKLITHGGYGIGWAKFIEGRVNNYLPSELRILM